MDARTAVSYTHLDVYKRQAFSGADWVGFVLMIAMIFLVTGEKPQSRREAEASGEVLEGSEGEAR